MSEKVTETEISYTPQQNHNASAVIVNSEKLPCLWGICYNPHDSSWGPNMVKTVTSQQNTTTAYIINKTIHHTKHYYIMKKFTI